MASQELINIIIKAVDEASATAEKVDNSLRKIGKTGSMLSKIPGFDTLKSKISSVATTLDGKLGGAITKARNKFNSIKSTVTGVASTLKGKLGSALDGVRNKLSSVGNGAKGLASSMSFLKGAVSMTVGMIGYDLVNSMVQSTRASMNARSSIQAFGSRLNMSATEVKGFQSSLDELQSTFKKVDIDVVGQQAMDMAYRLGLPKSSLKDLTETSAIFIDAMQRNGRSAEDATLALADAMDGEFRRLREIGISQKDLMRNGWSGDLNDKIGLLRAMNKALKEQHYDELAKSVDTLDDAWQVLSVTLGNLLESILLPLTPAIVGIITGFTDAINAIKDAWNGLPDWGKYAIGVAALALGLGILAGALAGVELASLPLVGTLYAMAGAVLAISWPVVAVVAAIALLVAAIYEVGKAFGWWTDVSSMLDAICAGLQRMWDAFINHPDVQAAIQGIVSAWQWLSTTIQDVGHRVMEFFGINAGGNFDVVRALIDGIGQAWEQIKFRIQLVIIVVQALWNAFVAIANGISDLAEAITGTWEWITETISEFLNSIYEAIAPTLELIQQTFLDTWSQISAFVTPILTAITEAVTGLITAFDQFRTGQMDLPTFITTILQLLWTAYVTVFTQITTALASFASNMISRGISMATNFVNGVINWIKTLPGKIYSALVSAVSRIISAGQQWVEAAKQKAQNVVDKVYAVLSTIPGKISGALSGVVSAIVKPFQDAYSQVSNWVSKIASKVSEVAGLAGGLSGMLAGGEIVERVNNGYNAGVDLSTNPVVVIGTGNVNEVTGEVTLVHDFINLPTGITASEVADIVITTAGSNEFGKLIAENTGFRDTDLRLRNVLSNRNSRANGV